VIRSGATVQYAILDAGVTVSNGATVGSEPAEGVGPEIAVVGGEVTVREGDTVPAGAMINRAEYENAEGGQKA
jgi:ADP-glucose pyrophosphorylase